jgi:DNA-binding GntR family transcriptional regulator
MNQTKIAPVTRAEHIQRTIEAEILTGQLRPGTRLEEYELAARFEVSRTPVREALRHLSSSGLIHTKIRQPAIVASLSIKQLIEMFEVMSELEALCARLAARRINKARLDKLLACHEELKGSAASGDTEAFFEANQKFHEALYRASQNGMLAEQTLTLRNRVRPYRRHVTDRPGQLAATIDEHEVVIRAIEAGDEEGAAQAMRSHVNLLGEKLTDFIAVLTPSLDASDDD